MTLNPNAQKWVAALRSGEYPQTVGMLTKVSDDDESVVGHCCLGVACELAIANGVEVDAHVVHHLSGPRVAYDDEQFYMPFSVMDWLGLRNGRGLLSLDGSEHESLAGLNDAGESFDVIDVIADAIETHAEVLGLAMEATS